MNMEVEFEEARRRIHELVELRWSEARAEIRAMASRDRRSIGQRWRWEKRRIEAWRVVND